MKNLPLTIAVSALLLALPSCKSREEKVSDAVKDGNKYIAETQKANQAEIAKASELANQEKQKALDEVAKAQIKLNETKLDAEKKIDDADRKVDDKKIDSQREITDAVRDVQKDIDHAQH